jgi:hypothetical protein
MLSVRHARLSTSAPADFPLAAERPPHRPANDPRRPVDSRIVLGGCAILLSVIAAGATVKALELRPHSVCNTLPVRLVLGSETATTLATRGGAGCTITVHTGSAAIDSLVVTSAAQHGSVVARGRTGVVYRPHGGYRGEDGFELALHGHDDARQGVAIVRARVDIR